MTEKTWVCSLCGHVIPTAKVTVSDQGITCRSCTPVTGEEMLRFKRNKEARQEMIRCVP